MDQLSDDIVVLVDESDRVIGSALKHEVHHSRTPLHRAFSVFLFNSNGEVLLQQRAFAKLTWPGVWSNSCCGHLLPDETVEAAAERRLDFELGLRNIELTMALPDYRYRAEKDGIVENEICPVLFGFTDAIPVVNPNEVAETEWKDWDVFLAELKAPGCEFSPWAIEEADLLSQLNVFTQATGRKRQNVAA